MSCIYDEKCNFKCMIRDPAAVVPKRAHVTDAGFDLTVIKALKKVGDTTFYDTGIAVVPDDGFYCKIYPRSSISKTGYIMANSTGIIDCDYRGNLIIALTKIDKYAPDLELPCRIAQLIPEKMIYGSMQVVDELDKTQRGEGGFGSTN